MTVKKKIFDLFFKNWYWKLLSLVAAALFWYAYMNIQDPVATETLNGVSVNVLHYEEFLAKGNHVEFEDTSLDVNNLKLNVTVRGRTSLLKELNEQQEKAMNLWIDLYELVDNDNRLSIHYGFTSAFEHTFANVQFVNLYNQSYYAVNVDEDITKTIQLQYSIVGSPGEDYIYIENDPNMMLTPTEVTLTGSPAELEEIEEAQILVSVEGIKANVALSEPIMYYDSDGSRVYLSNTVKTSVDAATLYIPIYQTKTVPVEAAITGEAKEGYEYRNDVTLSADSIVIYGQESDLKNINRITLPEINIGLYESSATEVFNIETVLESLYPNKEVQYYSGSKTFRVSFTISEIINREFEIPASQIKIQGSTDQQIVTIADDTVTITLRGTADRLDEVDPDLIILSVDVAGAKKGTQNLPLSITLPPSAQVTLKDENPQVAVTIAEVVQEEEEKSSEESE